MLLTDQHPLNKSIMVGILGCPNAGKSSLVNHLLGFDLTVVTNKAQTTRNQYHCTFTVDHTEIVLVDTPGVHQSGQEINRRMNGQVIDGVSGVDLNLLLIDLTGNLNIQFQEFRKNFNQSLERCFVVFTKCDLVPNFDRTQLEELFKTWQKNDPTLEKYFVLSVVSGEDVHTLTGALCDAASPGPHLYPGGEVSNKSERFFVAEYVREQAFKLLAEELPYELAVTVEEFVDQRKDFKDNRETKDSNRMSCFVTATIHVNRPSQRAIVIGTKGTMIKEIGTRARKKIEAMLGGQVHLNLHVKVSPKWFRNNFILEELGLPRVSTSHRVWRKREAGQI